MSDPPPPPPDPAKPWAQYLLQPHNPHPSPLSGTQDLISLFHLSPLYDTFLRPYLPANLAPIPGSAGAEEVEAGGGAVKGQVLLGKAAQLAAQGGQLKASPASPMPASSSAPAAGEAKTVGAGLKITLGGIKLAGTTVAAGAESADGAGAGGKKPKRPKMDKSFDYMVGDVLGRISQPHPSSHPSSSLLYLISNPDPAPCPPIHPLDPSQLRDAFTLKQGGLSGFDMSLWEGRGGEKGGGRKKKKRKQADLAAAGDTQKKQKR